MDMWLIILLVAVGVFLLVEIGLVLAGKKDLAKKLVWPFIALAGVLLASKALGKKDQDIRDEKDRIDVALGDLEVKADDLRGQVKQRKDEHDPKVDELEGQITQSDARAKSLEDDVDTLKEQGPKGFADNLSDEERQRIREENKPPSASGKFREGN